MQALYTVLPAEIYYTFRST